MQYFVIPITILFVLSSISSFCTPNTPIRNGHNPCPDYNPPLTRNTPSCTQVCVKGAPETAEKRKNKKGREKNGRFPGWNNH